MAQPTADMIGARHAMDHRHKCHFFYHGKDDPTFAEQERTCHYCQFRQFDSHEQYPISIVFEQDTTLEIPTSFQFIEKSIAYDVELAEDSVRTGCNCEDDASCLDQTCECFEDVDWTSVRGYTAGAYHVTGDRKGCLRGWMLHSRLPIYECHERCSCSERCPNRVVGQGRKVPLQVFPTANRGWGIRSTEHIKRGQFVGEYVGEMITPAEANRRRKEATDKKKKDIYLFALDKFQDQNSTDPRLSGEPVEIDGEFKSGPTRFINHSCDPNLRIFAVVTEHAERHLHRLCFFAIEDIQPGTELTFDYTDGVSEQRVTKGLTKCLCGAKGCRGSLW